MRKLLIIALLLITSLSYAGPWSIKTEIYTTIPSDSDRIVQWGCQISLNLFNISF